MAKIDDSVKKKVPELRFAGFADDWEERKLENIAQINKGIQRGKQEISSVRNELNPYPVYNGGKKASGYTDECNRENSVMVSEGGASAGYVNYYSGKYWSGGHNFTISNDTKHDTFFLLYVLQKSQEKLYKLQVGTGLPNIQLKSIKDFPIYSTSNTEQQKIGSFFKQLDNTIALHQRKLDLLKEQKKGYLQKMFPKNGAKVPELRFAGFADDWEERKLKNVSTFKQGIQVDLERQYQIQNDHLIRFIRIVDYTQNTQDIRYIDINTSKNIIQPDDIIMVRYGATAGFIGRGIEGILANNMFSINPTQKIVKDYLYIYLKQDKIYKQLNNSNGSSAMPAINFSLVGNLNITYPNFEEQEKIGTFFKQLDDTITLHQRKLDLLKEQKKGFLQKMFV